MTKEKIIITALFKKRERFSKKKLKQVLSMVNIHFGHSIQISKIEIQSQGITVEVPTTNFEKK